MSAMNSRQRLKELLDELFRIESSDLDFGIYRIMNQKREEINNFIEKDLDKYIDETLINIEGSNKKELEEKLGKTKQNLKELGVTDYTESDKYNKIKEELEKYNDENPIDEIDVYEHIYNFFKRYYDNGDFISQMRYSKENKYVIPYNGKEVYLHWANKDQYYIKTSEDFVRYLFEKKTLGVKVEFKVNNAELDKNNNKSDETRYFVLHDDFFQYEKENKVLKIYFEYRALTEEEKKKYRTQNDINKYIFEEIKNKAEKEDITNLAWLFRKANNSNKTILERHIYKYTKKNKSDYFIHKDLKGFLNRELDFYIKNEMLDLDTINSDKVEGAKKHLIRIEVFKDICKKTIELLDSIENFQKKLFTKKKFVLQSDYCLTLDRVPENIRDDIFKEILLNDRQLKEWKELYHEDIKSINDLYYGEENLIDKKKLKKLVIDAQFFDKEFKYKLLSSFDNLDEETDGLLIHSENYQALSLIDSKEKENIDLCIVDPPYNTKSDKFLYKDGYRHSSWLSMMYDRVVSVKDMMKKTGSFFMHIDENEHNNASVLVSKIFGTENRIGDIIWRNSSKNDENYVSMQHEYIIGAVKDKNENKGEWREKKEGLEEIFLAFEKFRKEHGDDWEKIHEEALEWYGQFRESNPISRNKHYNYMDENGVYFASDISGPNFGQYRYDVIHPVTGKVCKEPASGWRFPKEKMKSLIDNNLVHFGVDETTIPKNKTYLKDTQYQSFTSVKYKDGRVASRLLEDIFNKKVFSNPKDVDLEKNIIKATTLEKSKIIDPFAGSGTTGHATINLNKEDESNRKYILIEMGDYFYTVLKPRIQKVVFSDDWKEGKPQNYNGHSHMFKYIRLEQYEDSLRNVNFPKKESQLEDSQIKMEDYFEDYLIKYMLDYETQKSLLDIDKFKTPFDYKIELENENKDRAKVDLVETFNFLIGLNVEKIRVYNHQNRKYKVVTGKANGQKVIAVWRNINDLNMEEDKQFIEDEIIQDNKFDKIYINCDNYVKGSLLIEEQFYNLMFEE